MNSELLPDQQYLFEHLESEVVKTAVWRAWERLPEIERAFLRMRHVVIYDNPELRGREFDTRGWAMSEPPGGGDVRNRFIWLDRERGEDDLVNTAGHEFAHHCLRHPDMLHETRGAWQLEAFCEQQARWLAREVWGFEAAIYE